MLFACADWLVREWLACSIQTNLIFKQFRYNVWCSHILHYYYLLKWWKFTSALDGSVNIHHNSPPQWIIVNYFGFPLLWNPKVWHINNPWAQKKKSKIKYVAGWLITIWVISLLLTVVCIYFKLDACVKHSYKNRNLGRPDSTLYLTGEECKIFHPLCRAGYMSTWTTLQCWYMKLTCGNCEHRWNIHHYLLI